MSNTNKVQPIALSPLECMQITNLCGSIVNRTLGEFTSELNWYADIVLRARADDSLNELLVSVNRRIERTLERYSKEDSLARIPVQDHYDYLDSWVIATIDSAEAMKGVTSISDKVELDTVTPLAAIQVKQQTIDGLRKDLLDTSSQLITDQQAQITTITEVMHEVLEQATNAHRVRAQGFADFNNMIQDGIIKAQGGVSGDNNSTRRALLALLGNGNPMHMAKVIRTLAQTDKEAATVCITAIEELDRTDAFSKHLDN